MVRFFIGEFMKILVKWLDYNSADEYQFALRLFSDLQCWSEYKETLIQDFPKRYSIENLWHFDYANADDFLNCFEVIEVPDNILEIFSFSNVYFEHLYFPSEFFEGVNNNE